MYKNDNNFSYDIYLLIMTVGNNLSFIKSLYLIIKSIESMENNEFQYTCLESLLVLSLLGVKKFLNQERSQYILLIDACEKEDKKLADDLAILIEEINDLLIMYEDKVNEAEQCIKDRE